MLTGSKGIHKGADEEFQEMVAIVEMAEILLKYQEFLLSALSMVNCMKILHIVTISFPAIKNMFKFNIRNFRAKPEICLKLALSTIEQLHSYCSSLHF